MISYHVVPINDLREHETEDNLDCWCRPGTDAEDETIAVHNSLDGRELIERGERRVQ